MALDSRYFCCLLSHSQVGVGVNGDLTRLRNAHSVEGAGGVDLAVASRRYGIRNSGSFSLSALTASLLQRTLTKEEAVRRSAWQSTLSETQASTPDSRSTVISHRYNSLLSSVRIDRLKMTFTIVNSGRLFLGSLADKLCWPGRVYRGVTVQTYYRQRGSNPLPRASQGGRNFAGRAPQPLHQKQPHLS